MTSEFDEAALNYHRFPTPGKLEITATKKMVNQRDLALAYSPGVAAACLEIQNDPTEAGNLTARNNLVGVITNGTAVLGLGPIGALASKPVMEGKAVLFKKFANIDVFDLELDCTDIDRFVDAVSLMEPTFGGINLEDIKAPECFEIEKRLRERMNIPVFHDDQHGTAICVAAAVRNGLRIGNKSIEEVKLVCSGAGAAALACINLLVSMGLKKENITLVDIEGVVYIGRAAQMDPYKSVYAQDTEARTLGDVIGGTDVFLGLSAPRVLKPEHVASMADSPFILALANPEPEILPELVKEVRSDALIATGRSDYPNQVNNVLCFPFLFRGALDSGATTINEEMKIACVEALSDLATKESSDIVSAAYGGKPFTFGPDYLIPKPFDPRLMIEIPSRVAKAAMASGVATRPIKDFYAYKRHLREFVIKSGLVMKPVFEHAQRDMQRIVIAEGESRRVLNATQVLVDDKTCHPILIGRHNIIEKRIKELGLRLNIGDRFDVIDPANNPNFKQHCDVYYNLTKRDGVSPDYARSVIRTRPTALASLMLHLGEVDAMVCGVQGSFIRNLRHVRNIIGLHKGVSECSAVMMLILPKGTYFITDTHISVSPTAEQLAESTIMGAKVVKQFGMIPRAAMISHSNFGGRANRCSEKMRKARDILREIAPQIAVEGEMKADTALSKSIRKRVFPDSLYDNNANLLVMPNLDAANISFSMTQVLADGLSVGPMLVGMAKPVHILTDSVTPRGIVNMCAVAAVDAIDQKTKHQKKDKTE